MSFLTHSPFCNIEASGYDFDDDIITTYTNESNPSSVDYFDDHDDTHLQLNTMDSQQYWAQIAKKFKEHITSAIPSSEYDKLKEKDNSIERDSDLEHGRSEINQAKNRYGNILPYEQTRVKLKLQNGEEGSDYINANFVGLDSEYIAAQAPTPPTFCDFWRMIYECNCKIIVMLTKEYEGNKLKSNRYWPESGEEQFGDIFVSIVGEDNMIDYVRRDFTLKIKGSDSLHYVSHYHYLAWPDQGVPTEPQTLLKIMKEVNRLSSSFSLSEKSPKVIHCSAGVGRTGAYVVIDLKLKELQSNEQSFFKSQEVPSVSVMEYLRLLRNQRCGMITQKIQYLFCYEALLAESLSLAGSASDLINDESDGYDDDSGCE